MFQDISTNDECTHKLASSYETSFNKKDRQSTNRIQIIQITHPYAYLYDVRMCLKIHDFSRMWVKHDLNLFLSYQVDTLKYLFLFIIKYDKYEF